MGTFPYIAPEQYLRQRNDPRSDLFALGAMLYEAATGRLPFGVPARLRAVRRRLWRDPVPPRALRPDLPEWLQEIILRAMEVDPRDRYQSAAQMMFDLTHPAQVRVTERGRKVRPDGWLTVLHRWWRMRGVKGFAAPPSVADQIDRAPVLMVAVDLSPGMEALADTLLRAVGRMLTTVPDARVACVNVIRTARIGIDQGTDEAGNNLHVSRLVALRDWARGIDLADDRLTCTVLEGPDPGAVLVEHAAALSADHVIMGARGHSTARRYLGSVSSHVVAEATCSVTVMRLPGEDHS